MLGLGSGKKLRRTKHLFAEVFVLTVCVVGWSGPSDAATWLVRIDGSGDAMGIGEGIGLASLGDTVLVGPGTYITGTNIMKNGITLTSELGPLQTRVVPDVSEFPPGAISCNSLGALTEISGLWFDGFVFGEFVESGAIGVFSCPLMRITNNLFTNNKAAGVTIGGGSCVELEHNTFVGNKYGIINNGSVGVCLYNIIWDRARGMGGFNAVLCNDFLDLTDATVFQGVNFSADPLFCGSQGAEYFLQPDSPCAPGNDPLIFPCEELLGAMPVGCPGVPVEESTWGRIKSIYR